MAVMSRHYMKVVRCRLVQEYERVKDTYRAIKSLIECEHPDWGSPGAAAAHEAALCIIRSNTKPKEGLSCEDISMIRKYDRERAGLRNCPVPWNLPTQSRCKHSQDHVRFFQPSEFELCSQKSTLSYEPDPKDIALPNEVDDRDILQQGYIYTPLSGGTNSPCKTVTNNNLAAMMRRLDRCPITDSGLAQLHSRRADIQRHIMQIDITQRDLDKKLRQRSKKRYYREGGSLCSKKVHLGISRGLVSRLSCCTAVEDANDPFGEKDARCGKEPFWEVIIPCDRDVVW